MAVSKKKPNPKEQKDDQWESRDLGASPQHVRVVSEQLGSEIDEAMELQLISIRLQKQLIDDLKRIAQKEGIGYQPLIRQALTRFARDNATIDDIR